MDEDGGMTSCLTLAQREIKEIVDKLTKNYPRIKWQSRLDALVAYKRKWHLISEDLSKKVGTLIQELRKKYGCVDLPWQDTAKMTEEGKAAFEALRKLNYEKFQNTVLKDPAYVALDKKRMKACQRGWHEPKKLVESMTLISTRLADIFFEENKGAAFSVVEIVDDSTIGSAMEHGDLFVKLPHKKFSHH